MRAWLKNLSEIDQDCVHQYEYLLGRKLLDRSEYNEIDSQVDEMILEWEDRDEFYAAYPDLLKYAHETIRNPSPMSSHARYAGMLPSPAIPGHMGYYPVTSREEWQALPDLYKAMEWDPVPDPHQKDQLKAVKAVIFDVVHLLPYKVNAKVSVHPQEVQKILFCHFNDTDCHLYSVCGVELDGGSRLAAKWLQDSTTGAFGIYANGNLIGRQGGFQGYIPPQVKRLPDGSFQFDFQCKTDKTVFFELSNPFPEQNRQRPLQDQIRQAKSQTSVSVPDGKERNPEPDR